MKQILALFLFAALLGACSSSTEKTGAGNINPSNNAGNSNSQRVSGTNSNLVPYQGNTNPEAANGGQKANLKVIKRDDPNNKTKFEERPAPDNSVFESKLDSKGFTGTRTFKDHPILLKIVQTQIGKEKTLKVYLKNGKVFDVSEKKVPNFRVNSPRTILAAIGMTPTPDPDKNVVNEKKEPENEKN